VSASRIVSYEVHEGSDGLAGLRSAWESLEATGADHIFQTYAHADLWHRTVGEPSGARPIVVTLREGERVVGIFPACRVRQNGVPLLTWLGAPQILDYGDVLFDGEATDTPIDDFVGESLRLLARDARGALLYLTNVREDARAFEPLRSRLRVLKESIAPFVPIVGTWDEYLASAERKLRQDLGRRQRRLSEQGRTELRLLDPGDPDVAPALQALVAFQRARFDTPLNRTHLFDERYLEFRTRQAADPGYRVAALYLDDACIAAGLCAVFRGRLCWLVPGFDREYAAYSPGLLLIGFVIRSCFENGWDPFDFGWGDEPHKFRWTDSGVTLTTFVSDDVKGAVLAAATTSRHRIIEMLDRSRGTASAS
jgi:CelD/BcsL family acetyltransferase involved in cellulose biosynthesis